MSNSRENGSTADGPLVSRAAAGDRRAFEELVRRHAVAVRRLAARRLPERLRRRVSVADIVQEAQLAALEGLSSFDDRGEGAFRSWLFGIVEHKVQDVVRRHEESARRSMQREVPRGMRAETHQFVGRHATPSQVAIGVETARRARDAYARLPPDFKEVLSLTRTEGLDLRTTAERMGRSYAATRKLVSRALARFQEELQGTDGS